MKIIILFSTKIAQLMAIIILSFVAPYILLWCLQTMFTFELLPLTLGLKLTTSIVGIILAGLLITAFVEEHE